MKQSFGKTLISCFLAVTLMASVIAGAISVSVLHAKADDPADYGTGYFLNMASEARSVLEVLNLPSYLSYFDEMVEYCENNWDSKLVVVLHTLDTDNYIFCVYSWRTDLIFDYWSCNPTYMDMRCFYVGQYNKFFYCDYAFKLTDSTAQKLNNFHVQIDLASGDPANFSYTNNYMYYFPSYQILGYQDVVGYSNMLLRNYNGGNVTDYFAANLVLEAPAPPVIQFDLVKFKLGERSYLTTRDQNIIFNTQPLDDDYLWWIVYFENEDESEFDHLILEYKDLTLIPGADSWLNVGLQNVHSQGVLALDITDYATEWYDVWKSDFYWIIENPETEDPSLYVAYASAVNVPFVIVDQPNGQPDSYTQAFNEFNTYANNYNTSHVIPENLAQTLFGVEGGKLYPVTVSEPSSVASTRNDGALVDGNLYTFQWSMTEPSNLGYNYDLFDVVIIPSNYAGYYGLVYFYDSSLNPPYQFVDRVSFDSLLDSFDCIIILPDDAGTLEDNTWWQQLVPSSMRGDMAVGGTSSTGIEYVDTVSGNEFQGFMIVTQKAIQKQQLWNFNDGITKLYKLEVDYIDSEDKWKDSFLLWSASIFDMLNSIDGRLNSLLNALTSLSTVIDQIKTTLDDIAADPDPDDVKPWYLSLWLFMKQFEPSNAQISEGLGYLVDNIDDIPLLPALTPVPALPTPGGG